MVNNIHVMVVVCAIPKVYDSHSQPAYKPATSCSQLNLETTTGREPPVTLHTNITFRPNGRLLLKQHCSDNSIRSLSYPNVPTFKPSERSRVWSVRIWHDMPRIKNLVQNQYLKTTGPCPYFGWGTSYLAPFCDSAPSRESVKRACVSALLRVDGSLFYNVWAY